MKKKYLAVDIGGTFIKLAILDEKGNFHKETKIPTIKTYDALIASLKKFIDQEIIVAITFALPGTVDEETGTIGDASAVNFIINSPFKKNLETAFPGIAISMENDANAALLGEFWQGGFQKYKNLVSVVIGTGIGGAIMINREIYKTYNNINGEFGYALLSDKKTILSRSSSTKAILERYNQKFETNFIVGDDLFNDYLQRNNEEQNWFIDNIIEPLIKLLSNIKYFLNPDAIIIGGGISKNKIFIELLINNVKKRFKNISEYNEPPLIVASKLGNRANLLGSLFHFLQKK